MLKRLFSKKDKTSEGSVEAAAAQAAPRLDESGEVAEVLLPDEETAVETQATSEASEPSVEEPGAQKKGFFRGAWETTKRIALTPVDPWFEAVAKGLDRTRQGLVDQVASLLRLRQRIDEDLWEELEDILLTSDVGTAATDKIIDEMRKSVKVKKLTKPSELFGEIRTIMENILVGKENLSEVDTTEMESPDLLDDLHGLNLQPDRLNVVLMVGVNGTGKTTTTAKLANRCKAKGYKVLLGAADTFRAAAIDQLQVWGTRLDIEVIHHKEGSDPAAVVFDALNAAKARKTDVLFIDTAGRLQAKVHLMEELKKIKRVIDREVPGAPHEVLLVLDATTGQNGILQAKVFDQVVELTGLVLCKLDGTAKGGVVVSIAQEFKIPVKFIGVGEKLEDLKPFQPKPFLAALFGETTV